MNCSPAPSLEPRSVSFRKGQDSIDLVEEVKMRNNGSRMMAHAVPNPYSNSEY